MPFRNTKAILRNKEILRFEFISQEENDAQPQRHADYIYLNEFGHNYIWNKIYFMTIVPSFEIGSVTNSPNMYFAKTFSEAKGRKLNLGRHNSKKLPLTISITLVLFIDPSVLLATHL